MCQLTGSVTDISTLVSQYFDVDVVILYILLYFKLIDFDTFLAVCRDTVTLTHTNTQTHTHDRQFYPPGNYSGVQYSAHFFPLH